MKGRLLCVCKEHNPLLLDIVLHNTHASDLREPATREAAGCYLPLPRGEVASEYSLQVATRSALPVVKLRLATLAEGIILRGEMVEHWLISDTHFGHENIIDYAGRPFKNAGEMDAYMVQIWNERVKPQDHVYHLGDVTMERSSDKVAWFVGLIRSLHGHKRLVLGNHDHLQVKVYRDAGFEKIRGTGAWLGNHMLLSHFPVHTSSIGMRSIACVHGHIHEKPSPPPAVRDTDGAVVPYVNVCVEQTAYGPISVDEVLATVRRLREAGSD